MDGPGQILGVAARKYGDKIALVTEARTLSYTELDELSDRAAAALRQRGVGVGEVVSIYSPNRWEWVVAYHGALKAGAVVNPVNVMLTGDELRFVLEDCQAVLLFIAEEKLLALGDTGQVTGLRDVVTFGVAGAGSFDGFLDVPVSADFEPHVPDPLAASTIGYTSGTTGHPKGAVQSHRAVALSCEGTARMHGRGESDVVLSALPAPHVYGNVVINSSFLAGGTVVLMERFDAKDALRLIAEHRVTLFEGVPAMYGMLLAEPAAAQADLSSITRSTVGGQTISRSTVAAWEALTGAPLLELWGMTELSGPATTHWYDQPGSPGSVGIPLDGVELRIADLLDVGRTLPPNSPGELMVRGPLVMLGYFNNPEATREVIEPDGWMHTGDVGYVDETGHYFIVDRRKDMIITAGYNVYPAEIERVIAAHPAVALVAVGCVPDDIKGELARAYVVLKDGLTATAEQIIAHCREQLAAYKVPRSVAFVTALPQTSTGKIMRRALAQLDAPAPAGVCAG